MSTHDRGDRPAPATGPYGSGRRLSRSLATAWCGRSTSARRSSPANLCDLGTRSPATGLYRRRWTRPSTSSTAESLNPWFSPRAMDAAEPAMRAVCRRLVEELAPAGQCRLRLEGAEMLLGDVCDAELTSMTAELQAAGHDVRRARLDVTSLESWQAAVSDAEETFGPVTILVTTPGSTSWAARSRRTSRNGSGSSPSTRPACFWG
jgi:short chain dehydrogenase